MELSRTYDDTNETQLNEAREMLDLRDAELASLREESVMLERQLATLRTDLETLHTVNSENALMLDDIRLPLFKLLKDPLGAMVSGEIAEQLKSQEKAFDISNHFDEIREDIIYNFDISSFESEINEIISEHDIDEEVTEIVKDVLKGAKITLG